MNALSIINVLQLLAAILLIVSILLQQRGSGLSGVLGGDSSVYRTKRGAEKMLFYSTIVLAIIFLSLGLAGTILFA